MKKATSPRKDRIREGNRDSKLEIEKQRAVRLAWLQRTALDELLSNLVENLSNILLIVIDQDQRIMFLNRKTREKYRLEDEFEMIGQACYELDPEIPFLSSTSEILSSTPTGSSTSKSEIWFDPHGVPNWYSVRRLPVWSLSNEVIGSMILLQPVDNQVFDTSTMGDISRVVRHIHQNYAASLTISDLAKLAMVSVRHLERRFLSIFRMSPKQYLIRTRISAACLLLMRSQDSIADIAASCGFYDQSAFTRHFHQIMGISPLKFRYKYVNDSL